MSKTNITELLEKMVNETKHWSIKDVMYAKALQGFIGNIPAESKIMFTVSHSHNELRVDVLTIAKSHIYMNTCICDCLDGPPMLVKTAYDLITSAIKSYNDNI